MAEDASEVTVIAMILSSREALLPPTVRRVCKLAMVVSSFSLVTSSSKTLMYAMKAASRYLVVMKASVRLLVEPQEEGRFFFKLKLHSCTASTSHLYFGRRGSQRRVL